MRDFLSFGRDLLEALIDLGDYLFTPFDVPVIGETTLGGLFIGGGLFGILTFKVVKFFTDIIL